VTWEAKKLETDAAAAADQHSGEACARLMVRSRTQAVAKAIRLGLFAD